MEEKGTKESVLAILGIVSLCAGSCLMTATFPMDLFLWPGSRSIASSDRPELWITALVLMILGVVIFMYLWRDIVRIRFRWGRKRKDDRKL